MDDHTTPGLAHQSTVRTVARVVAVVLVVAGVVLLWRGISGFAAGWESPSLDSGPGPILTIGAGGFCLVFGLAAANVGWLGAQASYVAGETVPVLRASLGELRDGPFCSACGTRNDAEARFCDSCGQSLA